jgi:hypothetical protein
MKTDILKFIFIEDHVTFNCNYQLR